MPLASTLVTFLSTPPSRVATKAIMTANKAESVSIHATLAGGDFCHSVHLPRLYVSIHATLAGGDLWREMPTAWSGCFYPRHPRGWRRTAG